MIEDKVANAIRAKSKMFSEDALRHAVGRLVHLGQPDDLEAAVWLQDIINQRGMAGEHCENDRLVDVIDMAIRG